MDRKIQVHVMDEFVCISHNSIAIGKGMDPTISLQLWVDSRTD